MSEYEAMIKAFNAVYGEPQGRVDPAWRAALGLFERGWGAGKAFQQSVQPTPSAESDDPKPGTWAYFDAVTSKGG